jgi:hypothetical protein
MVFHKQFKKTWFALARTAKKQHDMASGDNEHVTGLQGMHAPHLLFVLDEASGIEDPNWEAAESSIREADNRLLAISNPLRVSGRMFQIFNLARYQKYWFTKQVGYLDSSRLNDQKRKIIEDQIEMYGENSPIVKFAFGKFPWHSRCRSLRSGWRPLKGQKAGTRALETWITWMGADITVYTKATRDS